MPKGEQKMSKIADRGALTKDIKDDAYIKNWLGREITLTELRLFPYLQYLAVNNGKIDYEKVSREEVRVIEDLEDAGWLQTEPRVKPDRKLWNLMCHVIYMGYVDYE